MPVAAFGDHIFSAHPALLTDVQLTPVEHPQKRIHIKDNQAVYPHQKLMYHELEGLVEHPVLGKGCHILDYKATGSGKTATLVLYHYALKAERTLILTPSRRARDDAHKQLKGTEDGSRNEFLRQVNALTGAATGPRVALLEESARTACKDVRTIDKLQTYDIVVATAVKFSSSRTEPVPINTKRRVMARAAEDTEDTEQEEDTGGAGPSTDRRSSGRKRCSRNPEEYSEWLHVLYEKSKQMVKEGTPPLFDLIIFDDSHHIPARTWSSVLETLGSIEWTVNGVTRKPFVAYCTGTPDRIRGVSDIKFDVELTPFTLRMAMQQKPGPNGNPVGPFVKKIVMLEVRGKRRSIDCGSDPQSGSESDEDEGLSAELERQLEAMKLVAHLLEAKRRGSDVPHRALITVRGLDKGRALRGAIESAGIKIGSRPMRAEVIMGKLSHSQCDDLLQRFSNNNLDEGIDVLINDAVLGEGFGEPRVSVVGVLRPIKFVGCFAQHVGRGVRLIRSGEGISIRPKDNVCHVVTHECYELAGIFNQFTQESKRQDEVEEDAFADEDEEQGEGSTAGGEPKRSRNPAGYAGAGGPAAAAGADKESAIATGGAAAAGAAALFLEPIARGGAWATKKLHVRRLLFPLEPADQDKLLQEEKATYFKDPDQWFVEDMELEETAEGEAGGSGA